MGAGGSIDAHGDAEGGTLPLTRSSSGHEHAVAATASPKPERQTGGEVSPTLEHLSTSQGPPSSTRFPMDRTSSSSSALMNHSHLTGGSITNSGGGMKPSLSSTKLIPLVGSTQFTSSSSASESPYMKGGNGNGSSLTTVPLRGGGGGASLPSLGSPLNPLGGGVGGGVRLGLSGAGSSDNDRTPTHASGSVPRNRYPDGSVPPSTPEDRGEAYWRRRKDLGLDDEDDAPPALKGNIISNGMSSPTPAGSGGGPTMVGRMRVQHRRTLSNELGASNNTSSNNTTTTTSGSHLNTTTTSNNNTNHSLSHGEIPVTSNSSFGSTFGSGGAGGGGGGGGLGSTLHHSNTTLVAGTPPPIHRRRPSEDRSGVGGVGSVLPAIGSHRNQPVSLRPLSGSNLLATTTGTTTTTNSPQSTDASMKAASSYQKKMSPVTSAPLGPVALNLSGYGTSPNSVTPSRGQGGALFPPHPATTAGNPPGSSPYSASLSQMQLAAGGGGGTAVACTDRPFQGTSKPASWHRLCTVGKGASGTVYKAVDDATGDVFCVKEIIFSDNSSEQEQDRSKLEGIKGEIALLRGISHPNVVKFIDVERQGFKVFVMMEFVAGGSLQSVIKQFGPLSEDIARKYTKQLVDGLGYLHGKGIIHRDIKGANILISTTGTVKLADFGSAKRLLNESDQLTTLAGTPYWMAPEVVRQQGHGKPADVWSLGCTVLQMLTGMAPYQTLQPLQALLKIAKDTNSVIPTTLKASPLARDFLGKCLHRDPNDRSPIKELQAHPWFTVALPVATPTLGATSNVVVSPAIKARHLDHVPTTTTTTPMAPALGPSSTLQPSSTTAAAGRGKGSSTTTTAGEYTDDPMFDLSNLDGPHFSSEDDICNFVARISMAHGSIGDLDTATTGPTPVAVTTTTPATGGTRGGSPSLPPVQLHGQAGTTTRLPHTKQPHEEEEEEDGSSAEPPIDTQFDVDDFRAFLSNMSMSHPTKP